MVHLSPSLFVILKVSFLLHFVGINEEVDKKIPKLAKKMPFFVIIMSPLNNLYVPGTID